MMRRVAPPLAVAVAATVALSGCSNYQGASSLPLPGGTGKDEGYSVTVVFDDATNLVAKETCRAGDAVVGHVESVKLTSDLKARVVCRIRHDVDLPANAEATIRQTSLLGERFVSFDTGGADPQGSVSRDAVLPASGVGAQADTEVVLGALSSVLNGGGLANLETITAELTTAMRDSNPKAALRRLGGVTATLNGNRDAITEALDGVARLASALDKQRTSIADALEQVPAGVAVLERQRPQLIATLRRLQRLSAVATPLLATLRESAVEELRNLTPLLEGLTTVGDELAMTLERAATFPFPRDSTSAIEGDYAGIYPLLSVDLDFLDGLLTAPLGRQPNGDVDPGGPRVPLLPPPVGGLSTNGLNSLLGGLLGGTGSQTVTPSPGVGGDQGLGGLLGGLLGGGR